MYICWQGEWGGCWGLCHESRPHHHTSWGLQGGKNTGLRVPEGVPTCGSYGIPVVTWSCASGLYGQTTPWFYGSVSCDPMSRGSMVLWFCVP